MRKELRNWIQNQLEQGFSEQEIIESMTESGYERNTARNRVEQVRDQLEMQNQQNQSPDQAPQISNNPGRNNQQRTQEQEESGSNKRIIFAGVGILALLLIAGGGAFLMMEGTSILNDSTSTVSDENQSNAEANPSEQVSTEEPPSFNQLVSRYDSSEYQIRYNYSSNQSELSWIKITREGERRAKSFPLTVQNQTANISVHEFSERERLAVACSDRECDRVGLLTSTMTQLPDSLHNLRDDLGEIEVEEGETQQISGRTCRNIDMNVPSEAVMDEYDTSVPGSVERNQTVENFNMSACIDVESGAFLESEIKSEGSRDIGITAVDYSSSVQSQDLEMPVNGIVSAGCSLESSSDTSGDSFSFSSTYQANNATVIPFGDYETAEVVAGNVTKEIELEGAFTENFANLSSSSASDVNTTIDGKTDSYSCSPFSSLF